MAEGPETEQLEGPNGVLHRSRRFETLVRGLSGRRALAIEVLVLVVALVARLGVVTRRGGLRGIIGYDCGVYFAGADALIHGRLPYRDFTMVHPPGITLVLTPFAALTRWMTDWHAFIVATLAFCLLGAVNAVLVVRVCRRLGFGTLASGLGGLFYAAWFGSVSAEFEVKLEPLGNFFLLCGLLLLLRAHRLRSSRADLIAGIVLGLTLTVKIWWGVPVLLLLLWHGRRRRSARVGVLTALGASIPVVVVYAPFFLADPSGMFSSVVSDQLGRARSIPTTQRIDELTTLPDLKDHLAYSTKTAVALAFAVILLAVLLLAWRASRVARALVALVIVQFAVLFAAPSWFQYYSDYLAVGLAVCVGAAASFVRGARLPRLRMAPALAMTAAVLLITSLVTITGSVAVRPFAGAAALTRAVSKVSCLTSVNTTVLLRLDAFTRGLEAGCPEWVDVTGRRYALPEENRRGSKLRFEREVIGYLRSGGAAITASSHASAATIAALRHDGVLARAGGHTVYLGG